MQGELVQEDVGRPAARRVRVGRQTDAARTVGTGDLQHLVAEAALVAEFRFHRFDDPAGGRGVELVEELQDNARALGGAHPRVRRGFLRR